MNVVIKTNIASGVGLYIVTYYSDENWNEAEVFKCDYPNTFTKFVSSWWNVELSIIDGKIAVKQTTWTNDTYIKIRKAIVI